MRKILPVIPFLLYLEDVGRFVRTPELPAQNQKLTQMWNTKPTSKNPVVRMNGKTYVICYDGCPIPEYSGGAGFDTGMRLFSL